VSSAAGNNASVTSNQTSSESMSELPRRERVPQNLLFHSPLDSLMLCFAVSQYSHEMKSVKARLEAIDSLCASDDVKIAQRTAFLEKKNEVSGSQGEVTN